METCCPACQTVFRVSDEQLAVANGQVRCGECDHVFNAYAQAVNAEQAAGEEDSLLDTITIDVPEIKVKEIQLDDAPAQAPQDTVQAAVTDSETRTDSDETAVAAETTSSSDSADTAAQQPDEAKAKDRQTAKDEPAYAVTALYPELQKAAAFKPPPSGRATFAWSVAILLLLATLLAQLGYFYRDTLASKPRLRPLLESMCEVMHCELQSQRAPSLVRLQEHKVLTHPRQAGALRVEAVIVSEADFRQTYPVLRLSFRDLDGRLLASRAFLPEQYLPTDVNRDAGMTPREPVNAVLDIYDPGKKAISYEFDFL